MQRYDELRTPRLLLRRWRPEDRAPYAALNADPEVMRFFPATLDRNASDAGIEQIEERFEQQGFGLWALESLETGAFLGFTGLNPMPRGVPGVGGMEVGWRLAAHAWHQGYATEAAAAAVRVALHEIGLEQVFSMTAVLNTPSQAVMRRLGMSPYAWFDHPALGVDSPLRPHVVYRQRGAPRHDRGCLVLQ